MRPSPDESPTGATQRMEDRFAMVGGSLRMMLACLDVDYRPDGTAAAACVSFASWESPRAESSTVALLADVAPYAPGMFFQRELPCLMRVLTDLPRLPDLLIVDGYVDLDASGRPGLGRHLFTALDGAVPVIGVAKTAFRTATAAIPVLRGSSKKPLWVSAAGADARAAAAQVASMHGPFRLPTLLRAVDALARASTQIGSSI